MDDEEFLIRYANYKEKYIQDVKPPECNVCLSDAEMYDIAAGQNYCEDCLIDDLENKDKEFFIEHTDEQTTNKDN